MSDPRPAGEADLYINRELSWLDFNSRVLEEARDPATPLLERARFAAIVQSNLDEFFMVRVARLKRELGTGREVTDPSGMTPAKLLTEISLRAHAMVEDLYGLLLGDLLPALAKEGIRIIPVADIEAPQALELRRQFERDLVAALTPLGIDSARPFPVLASLSLNVAVLLDPPPGEEGPWLAVVQVPSGLPRILRVVGPGSGAWVWLEDVIRANLASLFPGQTLLESAVFRVTRDSELEIDEDGDRDLRGQVEEELRKRRRSKFVRLEIDAAAPEKLSGLLAQRLSVDEEHTYRIPGPLSLRPLLQLAELPALEHLRWEPRAPLPPAGLEAGEDLFAFLEERDILLHHPYESFDPVVRLISAAAEDSDVLAIKQTLYRTSGDSPAILALMRAAERGKQVTVVVELRARFDEQSNLQWTRGLEEAGAHVLFGVRRYKTHAKICLVVRRTQEGIRRYVHLGTGNYNDRTAKVYSDFGLMTSDRVIGEDASMFFNAVTGYSDPPRMRKLVMAPTQLRERFIGLIRREQTRAAEGQAAEITAKVNSLVDRGIIAALYEAARAGVRIRLNVRGICCLSPGVKGLGDRISVVSIVDRYLEHSRVFSFRNGGDEEIYLSSADWMPRNLDRRVELLFPVEDSTCRARVMAALDAYFQDNVKSRWLQKDGTWKRRKLRRGDPPFQAQQRLYEAALHESERARRTTLVLEPRTSSRGGE